MPTSATQPQSSHLSTAARAAASPNSPDTWAKELGRVFRRVAIFAVHGTNARLTSVHGLSPSTLGSSLSLLEPTPLRWAVEAAGPVVGAGRSPGGDVLAKALHVTTPRGYAVIPFVVDGRLVSLGYGDNDGNAVPVDKVAELFNYCVQRLGGGTSQRAPTSRAGFHSTARRSRGHRARLPSLLSPEIRLVTPPGLADLLEPEDFIQIADDPATAQAEALEAARAEAREAAQAEALETARAEAACETQSLQTVQSDSPDADDSIQFEPAEAVRLAEHAPEFAAEAGFGALEQAAMVVTARGLIPVPVVAGAPSSRPAAAPWLPRVLKTGVAAAVGLACLWLWLLSPPSYGDTQRQPLEIPRTAGFKEIVRLLDENDVIRHPMAFGALGRIRGADRSLRSGSYRFSKGSWAWEILRELQTGAVELLTVTVPEGLTLRQIGKLLEDKGVTSATRFARAARNKDLLAKFKIPGGTLEGFLFPETYQFARGLPPEQIAEMMVQQFFNRLATQSAGSDLSDDELFEKVVLASIIEREVKHPRERKRIAGVFANRILKGMRLESCATVQYILGEPKKRLLLADLRVQSPYNTYLQEGLPPGPISNPGLPAIAAALEPEKHDFLFFVARQDKSNKHVFTQTFSAHEAAQKRIRIAARRKR